MDSFEDELLSLLPRPGEYPALAAELKSVFGRGFPEAIPRLMKGPTADDNAWDELLAQFSDVCTNIFHDSETQVVGIGYAESEGFVWVAEYGGIYGTFGFDVEPQGPFATLEEAISADGFVIAKDADLETGSLKAADIKMVVAWLASAGDQFRVNGTLCGYDGENLRTLEDDDHVDTGDE